MTTFIADFIFGPPGRKPPRRPSLADRLMARLRATAPAPRDTPRESVKTDDTGSPSPRRRASDPHDSR
jgi:hypothetical protein